MADTADIVLDEFNQQPSICGELDGAASERYSSGASVPLYVSGCIGTLAAVGAVMQNIGPDALEFATGLIALMGYAASFFYRKTKLSPRLVNFAIGFVVVFLIASLVTGRISIAALEPSTLFQGDLQMAVALQWLAVLYTWTLTDDRRVVTSAILAISTIGLVAASDVTPALIACFLIYVAATVFLLIHQNYLLHWGWGNVDVRRGGRRLLGAQLTLTAVCWLLTVLAGMVLVVPIQAVGSHLSLSSALKGLMFAGGPVSDLAQTSSNVAVSDTSTFPIGQGGSGSEYSLSKQVILQAHPSDGDAHYWRGDTYDHYTGQSWTSTLSQPQTPLVATDTNNNGIASLYSLPPSDGDQPPTVQSGGKGSLITRFRLVSGSTDTLYLPSGSFAVALPKLYRAQLRSSADGHIQLQDQESRLNYISASAPDTTLPEQLRKLPATVAVPAGFRKLYIDQLADSASQSDQQRLAAQAQAIVDALPAGQNDEFDKAQAICGWVRDRAAYSLDVSPVPANQDSVSYFLFTSRVGYCDLYASSMAVLCRYAGIPTRVATGFAPGAGRPDGSYDLRAIDKHAWCQVYFPGYGWVDFDPTSGTRSAPKQTAWTKFLASANAMWSATKRFYKSGGPVPFILTLAILGGLVYVSVTEGYSRWRAHRLSIQKIKHAADAAGRQSRDAGVARANAERRWQAARQELRRWNLRQKPSETAREFAIRAADTAAALSRRSQETPETVAPGARKANANRGNGADEAITAADAETVAQALSQLAAGYTQARYSPNDERLLQNLLEADESGQAERELSEIRNFVERSRPLAGTLTANQLR